MVKGNVLLTGFFRVFLLYDVAEGFDLVKLRSLVGPRGVPVQRPFPRRTPEYVRFEQVPIVERAEPVKLNSGEQMLCSIKYYAFAVVVVELQVPFECDWGALVSQSARWVDAPDIEPHAREAVRRHLETIGPAVTRPNPDKDWLQEEYVVINLTRIGSEGSKQPPASELLTEHGEEIAQVLRGESVPLSPKVSDEILQTSLSYGLCDLVVVGPSAALVYDGSEDATATNQVLEYAKTQLLEFRYYDGLMTRLLADVYRTLDEKRNPITSRWSLPRDARRVNTIRLDVMELTERIDNAIKFVSDMYYARLYRLAAARMGVNDYRNLVDEKLLTVGQLYEFMVDQFNEARSFVLEIIVTILALADVFLWLKSK
jgi:hypothetical protein